MQRKKLMGILSGIIFVIAIIAMFFLGVMFMKHEEKSYKKKRDASEARYQAQLQKEAKTDPESGKIILTDSVLKIEYEKYYLGQEEASKVFGVFIKFFIVVVSAAVVISCASHVIKNLRRGRTPSIIRIVLYILPLPVMIVALSFFSRFMTSAMGPKPEKAKIKTSLLSISRKGTKVTYDSDNNPTTLYYVYYTFSAGDTKKEESLKVTSSMYDSVQEAGKYYYVVADDDSNSQGFAFYPAEKYQIEVSN